MPFIRNRLFKTISPCLSAHQNISHLILKSTALAVLLTAFGSSGVHSQIFNVDLSLNNDQISSETEYQYIEDLEHELTQYIEDVRWTEDDFQEFERIRMNMQIIVNSVEDSEFSANLVVTAHRPIYNTMSLTPLLVINDTNWNFEYDEGQSLRHDENQHDELLSVIDYYSHMVLGFDYDTFSPLGGDPFFRRAERIVDLALSYGATGWGGSGSSTRRTRYHLVNQMRSQNYEPLRQAMYEYHRHGLDQFTTSTEEAREHALEAFELIDEARLNTSDTYPFDIIFDTKYREFTAFFMDANPQMRREAYNLLTDIDSGNDTEYNKLQQ